MVDDVWNCLLLNKTALINCIFSKIWLDYVQLAKMTAAVAIIADTVFIIVMAKVSRGQFRGSYIKMLLIGLTKVMVVFAALGLYESLRVD